MVYDGIIQGKTVRLRSVEERDAEVTYMMRSDPDIAKYIHAAKGTVQDQLNFIRKQREVPGDYLFLIQDLEDNVIGMKGLYNYNSEKREIESGRFIGCGSQVQNMESLLLCLDFAFNELKVERVNMETFATNNIVLGIQQKLGVVFTYKDRIDGFEAENIHSFLTKKAYLNAKSKIQPLIDRFADRMKKK